ncbi:uncharacterized protein LOC116199871 isoform X2 [Punica granatum]|uniref:Uncharacterized protein LOC116199871 isoform X2 n=1 Tax=Punica granatum TaxID=22663 RepID=A0A6P8CXV5_PUNGR|nr:uncharacterized protein LOC116199871 isoform X2 [Punica granatum]
MAALRSFLSLALFLTSSQLLLLSGYVSPASSDRVLLEDGYTVTTMIDGHKLGVNPHSVLPMYGSSDLIVLDSVGSAFYSVSLPISEDIVIERWSGDGVPGYSDGDMASAQFNRPRSFAVDFKGNVYVADTLNHAIRKITRSGVKTIAGGYSQKTGHADGPGQNASFSSDFELSFIPESCSLLISDHGNQLVRQILLKKEDCGKNNGSPSVMGTVSIWALGLCLSGFLGLAIGIAVRPYIFPQTGRLQQPLFQCDMEPLHNQSGEASTETLLRHQKRSC